MRHIDFDHDSALYNFLEKFDKDFDMYAEYDNIDFEHQQQYAGYKMFEGIMKYGRDNT